MKNHENITENDEWFLKLLSEAEKIGARVYLIPKLVVDYGKPYEEAVMAASDGTQTRFDSNVLFIESKYEPSEKKIIEETIILFNWSKCKGYGDFIKVIEWGLSNGLLETTPHVPFAIGEQKPNLNHELGNDPTWIFETTGAFASAEICYVCWSGANRYSESSWHSDYNNVWFAFRKKIIPPPPEGTVAGSYGGC